MNRKYTANYPGIRDVTSQEAEDYYRKGYWRRETLQDEINRHVAVRGNEIMFDDGTIGLTWSEFSQQSTRLALQLNELGIKPGETVAIQCPNWIELPVLIAAVARIGCSMMPLGTHFREREVEHAFRISEAGTVLVPPFYQGQDFEEMYRRISQNLGQPIRVISLREVQVPEGWVSYNELVSDAIEKRVDPSSLNEIENGSDDPILVQLTSGTTALPKVNVRSLNTLRYIIHDQYKYCTKLREGDVTVNLAPIAGGTGIGYGVFAPIIGGMTSYLIEKFEANEALKLVYDKKAVVAVAVPAIMIKMLDVIEKETWEFPHLKVFCNSSAPLSAQIAERIEKLMGCTIFTVYGSSDGGVPVTSRIWDPPEKRYISVGRLLDGMDCKLVDELGNKVPVGKKGEFIWKGPNTGLGYLRNRQLTDEYWSNPPWYASGDLGRVDEEGYYFVEGRKRDMIIRGGQNISPREIEEHLIDHPEIQAVAVIGMPDKVLGERVCAYIISSGRHEVSKESLAEFLSYRNIARYNFPERVEFMDEFPLSNNQKVMKNKLVEDVTAKLKNEGLI